MQPRGIDLDDYKKLENQPLIFVLAEFRFSTVMQISEYIPKLQELLRKQYPIPHTSKEQLVRVQPDGIALSSIDRWAFISADRKNAIDINQDRLVFMTANYPRFEGFSKECENAIEKLVEVVDPSLINRIGLRFSDLVVIDDSEEIGDLVDEQFAYPKCLKGLGRARQSRTENFFDTGIGGLMIRTLYGEHELTSLPDMHELPISITPKSGKGNRMILDFDHYWESKEESVSFDIDDIMEKLGMLHETSRDAFWKMTTDYARNEKWS